MRSRLGQRISLRCCVRPFRKPRASPGNVTRRESPSEALRGPGGRRRRRSLGNIAAGAEGPRELGFRGSGGVSGRLAAYGGGSPGGQEVGSRRGGLGGSYSGNGSAGLAEAALESLRRRPRRRLQEPEGPPSGIAVEVPARKGSPCLPRSLLGASLKATQPRPVAEFAHFLNFQRAPSERVSWAAGQTPLGELRPSLQVSKIFGFTSPAHSCRFAP